MNKLLFWGIVITAILGVIALFMLMFPKSSSATQTYTECTQEIAQNFSQRGIPLSSEAYIDSINEQCGVVICHRTGNGWQQIPVDDDAINGQGNGDHNSNQHQNGLDIIPPGDWDNNGRNWTQEGQAIYNNNCNVPQPSSSPSPSISPSPSVSPSPSGSPEPSESPLPSGSPSPSPSPSESPEPSESPAPSESPEPSREPEASSIPTSSTGFSTPGAYVCPDTSPTRAPANFHIYRNGNLVQVKWMPDNPKEGDQAIIYWGIVGKGWQHSLLTANDGFEVINLYSVLDYSFAAQIVKGCGAGPMSQTVVDGNTSQWVLFR